MVYCLSLCLCGSVPSIASCGQRLPLFISEFPGPFKMPAYDGSPNYLVNEFVQGL